MVVSENSFILTKLSSRILVKKNSRSSSSISLAKNRDSPETSKTHQGLSFPLKISTTILAQSAIAVFGLGFIDAGYSGDWSRIGAISKESEELLKVGAFAVAPLCLFLIFTLQRSKTQNY